MNRLGVTHECDRRIDRETDILIAHAVFHYYAAKKKLGNHIANCKSLSSESRLTLTSGIHCRTEMLRSTDIACCAFILVHVLP